MLGRSAMGILVHPGTVRAARFFAAARDRRRVLVCEIDVESASPNAVLVPIPAGAGSVEKIDPGEFPLGWDGRRRFFDDLHFHYVEPPIARPGGGQAFVGGSTAAPRAEPWRAFAGVTVPSDAAEIVDSPASLERLEPDLVPRRHLVDLLAAHYPGHALALCRLPAGLAQALVAVSYEPRDAGSVFFPLLQVTDGCTALPGASYRHDLFGRGIALDERRLSFLTPAAAPPATPGSPFAPVAPAPEWPFPSFMQEWAPVDLTRRRGYLPNEDLHASIAP